MKAKILLLSLATFAAITTYAEETDLSKAVQVKIKSASGLVIGGTDKPTFVEEADGDDSQVFYMIQSTHSNWPDGRPATYPGFFLMQKSSGKYIVEASFDETAKVGTLAYGEKPEFTSNGHGVAPTCAGHWVPNDDASKQGVLIQISLNQESHRFCALDKNNAVLDSDIESVLNGATVGVCDTPGIMSTAFEFELSDYSGDIWVRGPGLRGISGDWNYCVKLEKDASNPGVYYHNNLTITDDKAIRITLQNADTNYTLDLAPVYSTTQKIPFAVGDEDEFRFIPWQFYHQWQATQFGVFNLTLDLNMHLLSLNEGQGNHGSAVEEIEAAEDAPARYYNLQGVEVSNPENGIFIRVSGDKATKVIKR